MKKHPVLSSVVAVAAALLLLEVVLRITLPEPPRSLFVSAGPAPGGAGTRMVTEPRRAGQLTPAQEFVHPKPSGTTRIWVMGGSTAYGVHYAPLGTIPRWMEFACRRDWPGWQIEVLNAGSPGAGLANMREWVDEILGYSPDVVILLTGENEFLSDQALLPEYLAQGPVSDASEFLADNSMVYHAVRNLLKANIKGAAKLRWESVGAEGIDEPLISPQAVDRQIASSRRVLDEILTAAKSRGVPVLVTSLPVNEKDWYPGLALRPPPTVAGQFDAELAAGRKALDEGKAPEAITKLETARSLAPGNADAAYWLGRAHLLKADTVAARTQFTAAIELDAVMTRTLPRMRQMLEEVSAAKGASYLDGQKIFAAASPDGLVGWDLVDDPLHPSLPGQYLLARAILDRLTRDGVLRQPSEEVGDAVIAHPSYEDGLAALSLTPQFLAGRKFAIGMFLVVGQLRPRYPEAIRFFQAAADAWPANSTPWALVGYLHLLQADRTSAAEAFHNLLMTPQAGFQQLVQEHLGGAMEYNAPELRVRPQPPGPFGFRIDKRTRWEPFRAEELGTKEFVYIKMSVSGRTADATDFVRDRILERAERFASGGPSGKFTIPVQEAQLGGDALLVRKTDDEIHLTTPGLNPQVYWPPFPQSGLDTLAVGALTFRLKVVPTGGKSVPAHPVAELFWRPIDFDEFQPEWHLAFPIQPDGDWHEYVVPVSNSASWLLTPAVFQFRFNPCNFPADVVMREITVSPWAAE